MVKSVSNLNVLEEIENVHGEKFCEKVKTFLKEKLKEKNLSDLEDRYIEAFYEKGGIADKIAQEVQMKRTQLRKYFSHIKKIKHKVKELDKDQPLSSEVRMELSKLSFLLAYASGRREAGKPIFDQCLYDLINLLIKKVKEGKRKDFETFENFIEAIIAFHTFHRPREN